MNNLDFNSALKLLYTYIPPFVPKRVFPAAKGLARTHLLLKNLGSPQNKLKVIHIAGTSGKGSTALMIARILTGLGFKTGLYVGPHISDLTERYQIDNLPPSREKLTQYITRIIPTVHKTSALRFGPPTYFEILSSLAFYIFAKAKVDYAVIETGMGGQFDATNTINREDKFCVLTKLGLDHTQVLGRTIAKIAFEKAKIIHPKNLVVSTSQIASARKVIDKVAKENNARVFYVEKEWLKNIKVTSRGTYFDLHGPLYLPNIHLKFIGRHQAENAATAITSVYRLARRDHFQFNEDKIRTALTNSSYIGRFDIVKKNGKTIILDGAHNPQKMRALVRTLKDVYPRQKFHIVLGFKKGKDYKEIIKYLVPIAAKFTVTGFNLGTNEPVFINEDPQILKKLLKKEWNWESTAHEEAADALSASLKDKPSHILITGSLYMLSNIYPRLIPY